MLNETITLADLLSATNLSNGIPLNVQMVSTIVPYQFYIQLAITVLGSIFVFFILWGYIKPTIASAIIAIQFRKLMKQTGRNIMIIKHTAQGLFSSAYINQDTLREVIKGMQKFKGESFDIAILSPGGDVFASLYISRLIKQYPAEVRAIIPVYAMSGATLLALSCNQIMMNPTSCLGPTDPQLSSFLGGYGSSKAWNDIVKFKGKRAEDTSISFALMGRQYTHTISETINELIMDKIPNAAKRKKFVQLLTSGNIEHAKPLTPALLMDYGLPITMIEDKTNVILTKLLNSNLYEGVYAIKAPKE